MVENTHNHLIERKLEMFREKLERIDGSELLVPSCRRSHARQEVAFRELYWLLDAMVDEMNAQRDIMMNFFGKEFRGMISSDELKEMFGEAKDKDHRGGYA